ncbi:MAG: hypothetical protein SVK08_12240, partial [Halobacteriota archaeon]|nr:hypothetical protein [Halobacteriota archaeon]
VTYNFGFSFYIAVIALIILFALILKEEEAFEINQTFFLVWTIVLLVITLQQSRFSHILSINIAILCSYLFFKSKEKMKPSKKRSFILFMMIFLVIVPSLAIGTVMSLYDRSPSDDWYDSLVWMRENTPVTSYYDDPLEKPEYGVMSWWDYGNWIVYIAERPPIANNFLTGIDDSAHFFTTEDEEVASEILDDREARYVISDFEMGLYNRPVLGGLFISSGKFDSIAKLAGEDATRYYNLNRTPNSDFYNTMYARLHLFDGSNGMTPLNDTVIALGNYRLIYESRTGYESPQGEIKEVKIFEYLQGAKISGVTVPNTDITISTEVMTDQNRTFNYSKSVTSDEDGSFEFIVPYSTDGNPFNTRLSSPYEIVTNDLSAIVNVTEEEIKNGATVIVELL